MVFGLYHTHLSSQRLVSYKSCTNKHRTPNGTREIKLSVCWDHLYALFQFCQRREDSLCGFLDFNFKTLKFFLHTQICLYLLVSSYSRSVPLFYHFLIGVCKKKQIKTIPYVMKYFIQRFNKQISTDFGNNILQSLIQLLTHALLLQQRCDKTESRHL